MNFISNSIFFLVLLRLAAQSRSEIEFLRSCPIFVCFRCIFLIVSCIFITVSCIFLIVSCIFMFVSHLKNILRSCLIFVFFGCIFISQVILWYFPWFTKTGAIKVWGQAWPLCLSLYPLRESVSSTKNTFPFKQRLFLDIRFQVNAELKHLFQAFMFCVSQHFT